MPEEDRERVLLCLREIRDLRNGGEDMNLFLALLRTQGSDEQAGLFEYLDSLSNKEIEQGIRDLELRLKRTDKAA